MSDGDLAAIRARAEKASAPWFYYNENVWRGDAETAAKLAQYDELDGETDWPYGESPSSGHEISAGDFWRDCDARFIANAPADILWLLARVGELEALVAAKEQVTQRILREHAEELRIAKSEPERKPREPRYPEHDFGDEDILEDQ